MLLKDIQGSVWVRLGVSYILIKNNLHLESDDRLMTFGYSSGGLKYSVFGYQDVSSFYALEYEINDVNACIDILSMQPVLPPASTPAQDIPALSGVAMITPAVIIGCGIIGIGEGVIPEINTPVQDRYNHQGDMISP